MRYPYEENTTVWLVPAVADINAPTLAEIAAGTDVTCFLTKDGLNPGGSTAEVDSGSLCTRVDGKGVGSVSYAFSLKGFRDNDAGGDTLWDLCNWGDAMVAVVRRGITYGTAAAAAQVVETYEGALGEPVMSGSAANAQQTFTCSLTVQDADIKAALHA